jgi:hypothetical protein
VLNQEPFEKTGPIYTSTTSADGKYFAYGDATVATLDGNNLVSSRAS